MTETTAGTTGKNQNREVFSSRAAFIFAAVGSAVGLGNIWRFPYVAYESGGGAFLIPYLVALLTAGIPLLFLDYALGHRFRGSAPKVFRRIKAWSEPVGWLQVGIAFFITVYYSVIIAWAAIYSWKSINKTWGDDANAHFFEDFLQVNTSSITSLDFVPPIAITLLVVWLLVIGVLALGVDKGIGMVSKIFIPLLVVLFLAVVIFALFLDGAAVGLNEFFTPNWAALSDSQVWIAAYGQIFFSLSVAFGIMLTYASYLKPRSNLTGTGLVTAFANSSFEVLAGIGVFATLGFMATQANVPVDEVVSGGIGLAFIAFPTVISQMPGVLGSIFGVLFFVSLTVAGFTSLMSLFEVVVSAVQDKFDLARTQTVLILGFVMTLLAMVLFPTTTGIVSLDIMDRWTNQIGIVGVALISIIVLDWILRRTDEFGMHINAVSSFKVGTWWRICVANITPIVLGYTLLQEVIARIQEPYEGYSNAQLLIFGWGVIGIIIVGSLVMTVLPWRGDHYLDGPPGSDFGVRPAHRLQPKAPKLAASDPSVTTKEN
ncbi:sodium-dependent transporter [Corynebacterium sp. TAE3-ERU12]|uniref:sodium-dependent transporter n=1 Tax=Corynebacterium sp. TAE3-ERU12 TaxID=2849491 RepID=UPI001C456F0F|nr:sodium-dependent transporter [Corynebacterium sp. TAE3-ERU12]MBV7295723.1 sodium-dependent transporter [Corynebacterium sp. TAE3-ERU12]